MQNGLPFFCDMIEWLLPLQFFSVTSKARWTSTARYFVVFLSCTGYSRVAGIITAMCNEDFAVWTGKTCVTYTTVVVQVINTRP